MLRPLTLSFKCLTNTKIIWCACHNSNGNKREGDVSGHRQMTHGVHVWTRAIAETNAYRGADEFAQITLDEDRARGLSVAAVAHFGMLKCSSARFASSRSCHSLCNTPPVPSFRPSNYSTAYSRYCQIFKDIDPLLLPASSRLEILYSVLDGRFDVSRLPCSYSVFADI